VVQTCKACDGVLAPYHVERVLEGREDLVDLLRRPFSREGAFAALCCAVPGALPIRSLAWAGTAAVWAYYFVIVRHLGDSRDGFPGPTAAGDLGELKTAAGQGLAVWLISFLPRAAYVAASGFDATDLGAWTALDIDLPANPVWTLLPMLYVPAAVIAVALGRSAVNAFWPVAWARVVAAAPGQYARLVALFALCAVAQWGARLAGGPTVGLVPVLGPLAVGTASNLALFAQAAFAGGYVRRNSELAP
jgi:hypothetical protein